MSKPRAMAAGRWPAFPVGLTSTSEAALQSHVGLATASNTVRIDNVNIRAHDVSQHVRTSHRLGERVGVFISARTP